MSGARSVRLETFLKRMARPLGGRLLPADGSGGDLIDWLRDESGLPAGVAGVVVQPEETAELVEVARAAYELGLAMVPRGGGTGKVGGSVARGPDQIVVDLRRMNRLLEMKARDLYAVVEPGLVTAELDRLAGEHGLMYPPDPASWQSCTIGGNIATNAGGPRALKYGVTQRYVWGLEVVLAHGEVLQLGRRSLKGVAGYDLTSLFVGSEGTLGFVTRATMHLVPQPRAVQTAWLSFAEPLAASRAAESIFAAGLLPRMLELLDAAALEAVRPKSDFPIPPGVGASLLVETDGDSEEQAMAQLLRICELACSGPTPSVHSAVATAEADREAMRRARRLVSVAFHEKYPFKISDDIALPRSRMIQFMALAQEEAAAQGLNSSAYGHLGDGNLHLNLLCRTAEERQTAQILRGQLLHQVVGMGGTISGEHGIGTAKAKFLAMEQGSDVVAWQRRIKQLFDPKDLMNPGKMFV